MITDLLIQIALSNVFVSLALAVAALIVERTAKRPAIAHLLWVLVFVKLVTPPIVTIPVITIPASPDNAAMTAPLDIDGPMAGVAMEVDAGTYDAPPAEETNPALWEQTKSVILLAWLLGSGFILTWSLVRVYRFDRLLQTGSETAPPELQARAVRIARRLGFKSVPTICTTSAQLSPLVWWVGGKVRVVLPQSLLNELDTQQSQWILAHELAHLCRRDYLVRWLEWLACVGFWWNPLVWWGRHHLRVNEEICCDDLVLSSLKPKPRTYADSLLTAIEHFASPVIRPPAVASEINSGRFLRRRFRMIVSETTHRSRSRWLQACVLLGAMFVLPLGVVIAQDYDAVEKRLGAAVAEGEITLEQAAAMMGALRMTVAREGMIHRIREIEAAVKAGRMSRKEGAKAIANTRQAVEKAIRDPYLHRIDEIKATVKAGRMSREEGARMIAETRLAMEKAACGGEMPERNRFEGLLVHYKRMGVSVETLGTYKKALADAGVKDEQMEGTFGGMTRVVYAMKAEGDKYEMDPRMASYFKDDLKLTEKQIELVEGMARRILHGMKSKKDSDEGLVGLYKRMGVSAETLGAYKKVLSDAGVTDKQMEGTLGGMLRVVHEMKSEGDGYEMDPRMAKYLRDDLGLTSKQIELVEGIARRVLHGIKNSDGER